MAGHIADSGRVDWNTPEEILAAVRQTFGGEIALDPCSNEASLTKAKTEYMLSNGQDGLALPWNFTRIFVNPPFGRSFVNAARKLCYSAAEWKALEQWKEILPQKDAHPGDAQEVDDERLLVMAPGDTAKRRHKAVQVLRAALAENPQLDLTGFIGQNIGQWVSRCVGTHREFGSEIVLLVPAAVDTAHWQNLIFPTATAICFPQGRIKFVGAEAGAPMACALVYWGNKPEAFRQAFDSIGYVLLLSDAE